MTAPKLDLDALPGVPSDGGDVSARWYVFRGERVAKTDTEACGVESADGWYCTKLKGHDDGTHVAHTFWESGTREGRPDAVVDEWPATASPPKPTTRS